MNINRKWVSTLNPAGRSDEYVFPWDTKTLYDGEHRNVVANPEGTGCLAGLS
ncbi:MAG TPA: hypothetical protein VNY53_07740 [Bradyrhizobium sp.]|nr:hypothetical protein [Bradyrhizobium sp.]